MTTETIQRSTSDSQTSTESTETSISSSRKIRSVTEASSGRMQGRKCCNISMLLKILFLCGVLAVGLLGLALAVLGIFLITFTPGNLAFLAAGGSSIGAAMGTGFGSAATVLAPAMIPCLVVGPTILVTIGFGAAGYKICIEVWGLYRDRNKPPEDKNNSNSINGSHQSEEDSDSRKIRGKQTPWYQKFNPCRPFS